MTTTTRRVLMLSGGLGSWAAGKRTVEAHGAQGLACLFADTLIEDDDLYRFLVEAAADILGVPESSWRHLEPLWKSIPPLTEMAKRKFHLVMLRRAAREAIPSFHWVADGRTPFEVFRDTRFLGNTRVAKCSHILKQDQCRAWLELNRDPSDTMIVLGIDWQEKHRLEGKEGWTGGARKAWLPWRVEAPLCDEPFLSKYEVANWADREGLDRPSYAALKWLAEHQKLLFPEPGEMESVITCETGYCSN